MKFSNRLQYVFDHLHPDEDVWDFCCDHGYLGAKAFESGRFKNVYFVDRVESIIEKVKENFARTFHDHGSSSQAFFVLADGQNVVENVTGTVCITGVGGHVIMDILSGLAQKNLLGAKRLILGPHRHQDQLLKMIEGETSLKNYRLVSTEEVTEKDRQRIFFIFEQQ